MLLGKAQCDLHWQDCGAGSSAFGPIPVFHLTLHFDRLPGQFCRLLERLADHYIEHWRRHCGRAGEEECKFYKKYLKCSFGASCKYDHPELTVDWMPVGRPYSMAVQPPGVPQRPEHQYGAPRGPPAAPFPAGATARLVFKP